MSPTNETVAPASAEDSTLYVAIEISRKSWVVGVKSPSSEKIGDQKGFECPAGPLITMG